MKRLGRRVLRKAKKQANTAYDIVRGKALKVELFYWNPTNGKDNFGDYLSWVIVNKILEKEGASIKDTIPRQQIWRSSKRLLAVGSILHFAREEDVIWGSGVNGKVDEVAYKFRTLDVRSVRGPLTQRFLKKRGIEVPDFYGDPALLIGELYRGRFNPREGEKREYIFIPNLNDIDHFEDENTVSPFNSWDVICERILQSELVISTSLHGIILAESFGIPARLVHSRVENPFKYQDYYLGTNRSEVRIANSISEARDLGGAPALQFDTSKITKTFPFDLWN